MVDNLKAKIEKLTAEKLFADNKMKYWKLAFDDRCNMIRCITSDYGKQKFFDVQIKELKQTISQREGQVDCKLISLMCLFLTLFCNNRSKPLRRRLICFRKTSS